MKADKQWHNLGLLAMGKTYYDIVRRLYEDESNPSRRLKFTDLTEVPDERLISALEVHKIHTGDNGKLDGWMEFDSVKNQGTLVIFLRAMVDVPPHTTPANCDSVLEALNWCIRNNVPALYADLWHEVRGHFDRALEKSWIMASAVECTASVWYELRSEEVNAVCPAEIKVLFQAGADKSWGDLVDELTTVVSTSAVGKRIFEVRYHGVAGQRLSKYIDQVVSGMATTGFTNASLKEARVLIHSKASSLGKDFHGKQIPRNVTILYRGLAYTHWAVSFADEANHKLFASMKAIRAMLRGRVTWGPIVVFGRKSVRCKGSATSCLLEVLGLSAFGSELRRGWSAQ